MNNQYFYCYSLPLEVGSMVKPGNWGRILKTYKVGSPVNPWLLVRELIFEQVRREHYPNKPSRLESIFLCTSEAGIKQFRTETGRNLDLIYRVELVDSDAPQHLSDWRLANFENGDDYVSLEKKANLYWQADNVNQSELITTSNIRITGIINP